MWRVFIWVFSIASVRETFNFQTQCNEGRECTFISIGVESNAGNNNSTELFITCFQAIEKVVFQNSKCKKANICL